MEKDLSHFWELGGGRKLVNLLNICITPENLSQSLVVISVDMSKPSSIVDNLEFWLKTFRNRMKVCLGKLTASNIPKKLKDMAVTSFGADHSDINKVSLSEVPILIVANKFDLFMDSETELLKVMARTLRAIAHSNGASLLYMSKRHKALHQLYRSRISRHVLSRAASKTVQLEHSKPLSVPVGCDSFEDIGLPAEASSAQSPVQAWCAAFAKYFPANESDKEHADNLPELQLASEPQVDQMLAQKDEELKQIKRKMQLKRRMKQADTQVNAEFKGRQ